MQPLGLRLDGAYDRFGAAAGGGSQTTTSGTLNVTYRLPTVRSPLSPYVIAGAGAYHLACSGGTACDATTRFGWNGGLGVRFAGLALHGLVEARYHRVALPGGDVSYFPLSLGLTF
jgi:opacity protein-like surface antigen